MSKKLYGLLLPVLATLAFASMGAAAHAAPLWEICKNVGAGHKFADAGCSIATGGNWEWEEAPGVANKTRVFTAGELTLTLASGAKVTCQVADGGFIWNTAAGGMDEITFFSNYECISAPATACPTPEIKANGLPGTPWKTELAEVGGKPVDKIKGITVTLFCSGSAVTTFNKGELAPTISESAAHFTGATGELENAAHEKAKVEGLDGITTSIFDIVRAS